MTGLRFDSSDDMHDRVIALFNGEKPKDKFDELALAEFKKVNESGGFVTFASDLPDPVDDYERHVED